MRKSPEGQTIITDIIQRNMHFSHITTTSAAPATIADNGIDDNIVDSFTLLCESTLDLVMNKLEIYYLFLSVLVSQSFVRSSFLSFSLCFYHLPIPYISHCSLTHTPSRFRLVAETWNSSRFQHSLGKLPNKCCFLTSFFISLDCYKFLRMRILYFTLSSGSIFSLDSLFGSYVCKYLIWILNPSSTTEIKLE